MNLIAFVESLSEMQKFFVTSMKIKKKRSKQKFADEKTYLRGTGGGPVKPKIIDDIDKQVKEIIGTQMTGFDSEFDGDSKYGNMQMETPEGSRFNISDSELPNEDIEQMEEDGKDSNDEDSLLSAALPTNWNKITPEKLRTPKSKPLKTILKKACANKGKFCNNYYISNYLNLF
ncbi:uncharacterized protein LOC126745806 isoform X1 [Anthonomus grandis grandis]|uniref:uncharacterized protein LOC126745806 isoform X1 n=1 Tax=Anthonomus grandis grandis TaxID=2921223 RepID=UPI002165F721|nr:uncharacterized protein LOC126745806 isoform X1 [Anthonomus grandis grandis]